MPERAEIIARELETAKALGLIVDPSQTASITANLELLAEHYRLVLSAPIDTGGPAV